jgi:outer membrane lipoprotein-sorting protein
MEFQMSIKNTIKILTIIAGIFLLLFLVGCKSAGTDEAQIGQIAENIEEAIEEKDEDLFMESVSSKCLKLSKRLLYPKVI